jgi:molecular chaperone IbpA
LNAVSPLPYHFCAGRYQCFGTETQGSKTLRLHETTARPDGGRVTETVAQWRTTLCVPTISPRFIVPPSASTASSACSTAYRISVAVSGFSQGELSIVAKENTLTIKGEKSANENGKDNAEVLYRGIAARAFERVFQLADFVQVKNASLENGLLHVDLVREIPEAKKPRSIPINSGANAPQVVDASVAA